jgi:hypothetical protein
MNARIVWSGLAVCLALAFALWPFEFQLPSRSVANGARITSDGALAFEAPGIVVDRGAGALLYERLAGGDGVTLAVVAESYAADQTGPARLVALSRDPWRGNVVVGQEGDRLVFRLRTPKTGPFGEVPGLAAPRVIAPGRRQLFVVAYDGERFRIHADGRLVGERRIAAGPLAGWTRDARLTFGNETTGTRPWLGRIVDVAVFDVALEPSDVGALRAATLATPGARPVYRLSARCPAGDAEVAPGARAETTRLGTCELPAELAISPRFEIVSLKTRRLSDYVENAGLWLVVGLLLARARGRARLLATVVPLVTLAAGLEAAQALVPARTSSLFDVTAAIVGSGLGAAYGRRLAGCERAG